MRSRCRAGIDKHSVAFTPDPLRPDLERSYRNMPKTGCAGVNPSGRCTIETLLLRTDVSAVPLTSQSRTHRELQDRTSCLVFPHCSLYYLSRSRVPASTLPLSSSAIG